MNHQSRNWIIAAAVLAVAVAQQPRPTFAADPPAMHLDRYGDPLPEQAVARLGTVRFRPLHGALEIAISPDGKRLATGSSSGVSDGMIELWDMATGKCTGRLAVGTSRIMAIAWSPDGKRLAVSHADHKLEIFDVQSGKSRGVLTTGSEGKVFGLAADAPISCVRWSPTGRQIAAIDNRDNGVYIFDAVSHEIVKAWNDPNGVASIEFSADGKRIAIAGRNFLEVRDVAPFGGTLSMKNVPAEIGGVAFSPDGKTLAAGASLGNTGLCQMHLWNAATGEPKETMEPQSGLASIVSFSADGKTLAYGGWGPVRIWDLAGERIRATLEAPGANGQCFSLSLDGKSLVTADHRIVVWDMATCRPRHEWDAHDCAVFGAVCLPDGKTVVSASGDGTIRSWDLATSKLTRTVAGAEKEHVLAALAMSRDGKTLATGDCAGATELFDADSAKSLGKLPPLTPDCSYHRAIGDLDFSPAGNRLAASDTSGIVTIWDVRERALLHTIVGDPGAHRVRFSPDGKLLAWSAYGAPVHLRSVADSKEISTIADSAGYPNGPFDFSPDGRAIFTQGIVNRSPDGKVSKGQEQNQHVLRRLDCQTGVELWSTALTGEISLVAASSNGQLLATNESRHADSIQLWSAKTGKLLLEMKGGHTDTIRALAFTPDSSRLVSASLDTTLLVWDITPALKLADAEKAAR